MWLAGLMKPQPIAMNSTTIATLVITIRPLTNADSRMPRISSSVSTSTMNSAGRLMIPWDIDAGDVVDAALERRVAPRVGDVQAEVLEQLVEVFAPGDADGRGADRVFEDQVPADDPGDQLAHRRVRVGVRAARHRDHRRELGVAEARERAADRRDDEPERDRRAGVVGGGGGRAHEQARADDGADAERRPDRTAPASA